MVHGLFLEMDIVETVMRHGSDRTGLPEPPIFEISGSGSSCRQIPAPVPSPTPTPGHTV